KAHASEARHAAEETISCKLLVQPEHTFFEPHRMCIGNDEGYVSRNCANVTNMVIEPLQFEADRAQGSRAWRRFDIRRSFDRMAEGRRVRKTGIAGNAFRQSHAMWNRQVFEQLLRALMSVEKANLQVQHRLTRDAKQKMPRLNGAGMNWTHGNLKHT